MLKTLSNSGKFLSSPVSFLLICLWIWNDHIGKWEFHNTITGKISDITGLIVFPFLLTALASILIRKKELEKILFFFANLSIILLFFIINWDQEWNNWIYANCFGNQNGFADKSDLLCIPLCSFVNYFFYKKYSREQSEPNRKNKFLHIIAIILASVAFINTSTGDKKDYVAQDSYKNDDISQEPISSTLEAIYPFKYNYNFFIEEDITFSWYTKGNYKYFSIFIFKNHKVEKEFLLTSSQLKKRLTKSYGLIYFYTIESFLSFGNYEYSVLGSNDLSWSKNIVRDQLNTMIKTEQCNRRNISCSSINFISIVE